MGKIIAVANQKGGVGKTTTAINAGACLAAAGRRCVLVDLDPQANAYAGLDLPTAHAGPPLWSGACDPAKLIHKTSIPGLGLIPLGARPVEVEQAFHREPEAASGLQRAIRALATATDFVFLDCPPSLGVLPRAAFGVADSVLVPIQCEFFALQGLTQLLQTVREVRHHQAHPLPIEGILVTMYDDMLQFAAEVVAEIRGHFPRETYPFLIPRDVALAEASSHGKSILEYSPTSRGCRGYIELAKEVLDRGSEG